jgi:hypothetical protein
MVIHIQIIFLYPRAAGKQKWSIVTRHLRLDIWGPDIWGLKGSKLGPFLKKNFFEKWPSRGKNRVKNRLRTSPSRENASLTLIQRRNRCIEAKIKNFRIFMRKPSILRFSRWGIDCAHSQSWKCFLDPESGSRKQPDSGKKQKIALSDFRFNTPILSLNEGQGSIFTRRGCAQSIFHSIFTLRRSF